jgi:hypothetical protein
MTERGLGGVRGVIRPVLQTVQGEIYIEIGLGNRTVPKRCVCYYQG